MNKALEAVTRHGSERKNLLAILHDIQDANPRRYLSGEDLATVAGALGLPVSEVRSTASFYTMFSFKPRGRYIIRVCESPPCHIMGAGSVFECLEETLGVGAGATTADGLFTLEASSCLGICGVAPAMMIDDEAFGNLTPGKVRGIIESYRASGKKEVPGKK